ncbi:MAG: ABC transporter permease [Peptoniphilaceae bacterium]|nr:ABC transporter permease [Peptoniphilaceae bacterium]
MSFKMRFAFARKSFTADRLLQIPYLLAMGLMFALFLMSHALLATPFVQMHLRDIAVMMKIGQMVVACLVFAFAVYANGFLMKRRKSEFALYGVLGLEKKHIVGILALETAMQAVVVFLIAIAGGFLMHQLSMAGVARLLQLTDFSRIDHGIPLASIGMMMLLLVLVFGFIYFRNAFSVNVNEPLKLLEADRIAEAEPKPHPIRLIVGLICLFAGYSMAVNAKSPLERLSVFFPAVFLVIVATYLLFTSFTIWFLKRKKKSRRYYENPATFLSTSGMLFRMRSHAAGLASIAILLTGIVVTLTCTTTLMRSIEERLRDEYPATYRAVHAESSDAVPSRVALEEEQKMSEIALANLDIFDSVGPVHSYMGATFFLKRSGDAFEIITSRAEVSPDEDVLVDVMPYSTYRDLVGEGEAATLSSDEVLIGTEMEDVAQLTTVKVEGRTFHVSNSLPLTMGSAIFGFQTQGFFHYLRAVISDEVFFQIDAQEARSGATSASQDAGVGEEGVATEGEGNLPPEIAQWQPITFTMSMNWDGTLAKGQDESSAGLAISEALEETLPENQLIIGTRAGARQEYTTFYSGFLYLGITVSALFLIGTALVTYFKQVAEAYEDRRQYQVLREVGFSEDLIRKTTRTQILWLFFLPLLVALIHSLVASPILKKLLNLLSVIRPFQYESSFLITMGILALVYLLLFESTALVYRRIVSDGE